MSSKVGLVADAQEPVLSIAAALCLPLYSLFLLVLELALHVLLLELARKGVSAEIGGLDLDPGAVSHFPRARIWGPQGGGRVCVSGAPSGGCVIALQGSYREVRLTAMGDLWKQRAGTGP